MPSVPYQPFPTARPAGTPTPYMHENVSPAAFGGDIARAIEGEGHTISEVGGEVFSRALALQQLNNEAEAREADAKYMIGAGQLHASYSALEGKNAVDAYPKYVTDLQKMRSDMRNGLSNPAAQKIFDANSLSTMGRTIFNGAGHAATQQKQYVLGASQANVDASHDEIAANPGDDQLFEQNMDKSNAQVRYQGQIKGESPEQIEENVHKNTATAYAHRITGLAKEDPWKAGKMLEEHRQELGMLGDQVENTVRTQQRTAGARNISDRVNADFKNPESELEPEKGLTERIKDARSMAQELNPKDELLPDYAEQRVTADYAQHKKSLADDAWRNSNVIDGALVGVGSQGGALPTTIEGLKAINPKVGAAFDALPEQQKLRIMKALAQNAKVPEQERSAYEHSEEGLKRYQTLKGQAFSDPAGFLNTDIPNERFTSATRKSLINLQEQLKAKAETDPRVQGVLEHLRASMGPDMQALGIYHRNAKDPDAYDHFVGALQQGVDQYWETHKKKPDAKTMDEMGAQLMRQTQTPGALFGRFWPTTEPPMYEVPQEKLDALKAEAVKRGGTEPSDTEARRALMRQHFKDFYGGQ